MTCQSWVGGIRYIGALGVVVSIKFSRIPRSHSRFDFRQFWQIGVPSSHFRWRDLQVRHPVRTRLGFALVVAASLPAPVLLSDPFMEVGLPPTACGLLDDFFPETFCDVGLRVFLAALSSASPGVNKPFGGTCCDCSALICIPGPPWEAYFVSSNGVGSPYTVCGKYCAV